MVAAISAARRRASVVLCEKHAHLGRKVLASGNGRCNCTNEFLDETFYNSSSRRLVSSVLSRFGNASIKTFFEGLGLKLCAEGPRVFPATNQASSVVKVLELELKKLSVTVETGFDAASVAAVGDGFIVTSETGGKVAAAKVLVTGGGRSYPALGSDGSAYAFAAAFGHTIVEPVPAAVPLVVKDPLCHALQGQKIAAKARSVIRGEVTAEASGDLLFTAYGLSGTAILDISDGISVAINRRGHKDAAVSVDLVPFMDERELGDELARRVTGAVRPEDLIAGILPNKFGPALKELFLTKDPRAIAAALKDRRFSVTGTRGWNEADFTAGGIDTSEVDEVGLGSKLKNGLHFAGEILDVNGARGGYNLAWAWASGFVAGEAAANA